MSWSLAEAELRALSEFQRALHLPLASGAKDDFDRWTPFYSKFEPSHWSSINEVLMPSSESSGSVVYTPNCSFHFLLFADLCFSLPVIKVREEYVSSVRIAWPHNIGTAPIVSGRLCVDDRTVCEIDRYWCDIVHQVNMEPGFRDSHKLAVGSIPALEQWTHHLPAYRTNTKAPFSYGEDLALAFPLHYFAKAKASKVEHRFVFRRAVKDLLRMQVRDTETGAWTDVKPNFSYLLGVDSSSQLPTPELWGTYAYVTKDEVAFHQNGGKPRTFYVKNVVAADATNPSTFGTCTDIDLRSESSCLALFWMAENITAARNHVFSNYTTGPDLQRGFDPVSSTSLVYVPGDYRFKDMTSDHFSISQPRKFFLSPPSETGYHAYAFCTNPFGFNAGVGVPVTALRARLSVRIDDTDIFKVPPQSVGSQAEDFLDDDDAAPDAPARGSPKFLVRVRLYVLNAFTVRLEDQSPVFEML